MVNYLEVFELLPQPCLLWEFSEGDFRIWNLNKAFLKLTGMEKEEQMKCSIGSLQDQLNIHKSCSDKIKRSIEACFEGEIPVTLEPLKYNFRGKGENVYWSITNIVVECELHGQKRFVLTVFKDISTEIRRKRECQFTLEELNRRTERSRCFIEENSDGLFTLEENGNFLSVNEGLLNLAELNEREILERSFIPLCADYEREKVLSHFQKALQGEKQQFRTDFISANGNNRILDISLVPFKLKERAKGVYGIAKDVTEILNAEEKARKSEENLIKGKRKFKALVQEGSDMIAIINSEGYYEFVSDSVFGIIGKYPEEYLGKLAFNFMHPEDQERVFKDFQKLLESKQILISPFRIKNGCGEWRWIESKATNLLSDPDVNGIVVNSKDVTEAFLQQIKIEEINERYRLASCASEDLIYDWDLTNNEIIRNQVFEENYGYNQNEATTAGEVWFNRIYKNDRQRITESFKAALKDPALKKWTEEYRFVKKDNKISYLVDRAYILRDIGGKAVRVVGAVLDVTESKEFLQKIENQNTLLKEIAWEQAHIIRAPLARMKTLIDALEDSTFEVWSERELIQLIKSSADELDEIILNRIQKIESTNA